MSIEKVTGSTCASYVGRALGFGNLRGNVSNSTILSEWTNSKDPIYGMRILRQSGENQLYNRQTLTAPTLWKCSHDTEKRICGLVQRKYDDGGLYVSILGNENINFDGVILTHIAIQQAINYDERFEPDQTYVKKQGWSTIPNTSGEAGGNSLTVRDEITGTYYSFDDYINLTPQFKYANLGDFWSSQGLCFRYQKNDINGNAGTTFTVTSDPDNTLEYGTHMIDFSGTSWCVYGDHTDPLALLTGNIYGYGVQANTDFYGICPQKSLLAEFTYFDRFIGAIIENWNGTCIPYNLILFDNEADARNYLNNGVISSNAYLYPLDFENLPGYHEQDDDGTPGDDDNISDDNSRDVTPNLPIAPTFTPSMLNNNNYYWLTAEQLAGFINWFWNDVGSISDIDDLLAKIEGLFNNLSQAIINIRYMPLDNNLEWIGGVGSPSNIKIAQIEKEGAYQTIPKTARAVVRDIGHITINRKYKSFLDLPPYSQLSLYLPYHGFIDLDMDIFNGHDLYVKAVYDYMSGTIQYFIYYDNEYLINTIVAKMAVDIPVSLQTKNDRDSAIFSNVSNAVAGLIGAGVSVGTGNPMGLVIGANAFGSGINTAPINSKGTVGETGAFFAPPQCAIIIRRPTVSKPSQHIWQARVGQICGKAYTLSNLKGYTTVYNPHITFTGNVNNDGVTMKPLESEIDEIYNLLEKGVIL